MDSSRASLAGVAPTGPPRIRSRGGSLSTKLVLSNALLIASSVCLGFFLLSVSIRSHTRSVLAAGLARRQQTIVNLQARGLEQLLRTSALMTDSPTLRAAMETYRGEATRSSTRPDLLETIQVEVDRIAAGLGRDLFVVTDQAGRILAWNGGPRSGGVAGSDFASHPVIRRALKQNAPVSERDFAVIDLDGEYFRVGSVPIVLQEFVIGTLTIGDRIDHAFVHRLQESFDGDFVAVANGQVIGSTLRTALPEASLHELGQALPAGTGDPRVVELAGAQHVAAGLSLGLDDQGHEVDLYLLNSLTAALGDWSQSVVLLGIAWGLLAAGLAGLAAWKVSRSVLRPLEHFVGFMRAVGASGDHGRRFAYTGRCLEIETLNEAYNQLMDSLLEHERRMLQPVQVVLGRLQHAAKDDLDRLERLKESEKLAALGRMLSGAAHEINNPLTGIFGNVELLLRYDGLDPAVRSRLERVRSESQRVVSLVRNLLKISHRDTGEMVSVEVQQVLREAVDVRRHDFSRAGLQLDLEPQAEAVRVLGSELELYQVFLNIINNAFDALKEAGGAGRLVIRSEISGGRVALTFADNGPGMKDPRQVFEHFYTTKGIGKGTGLGLSICHTIVQRHGGEIAAENAQGGGACFRVTLPLAAAERVVEDQAPQPSEPGFSAAEPFTASVLIVDDEPSIVELQMEILSDLGASVVGVGSGDEAIAALRQRSFDIIVTDLKMPGAVSGQDLFRWVESNLPEATKRFVFVTGDTVGEENRGFIEGTGARFLPKPFSMQEYVHKLREVHEARTVGR